MMKFQKLFVLLLTVTPLLLPSALQARLNIEITGGVEGGIPIAIVPFGWEGEGLAPEQIGGIVQNDLARSGQFTPLTADQMIATPSTGKMIDFALWRQTGIDNIVVGRLQPQGGDQYILQFQLFDIHRAKQLSGYSIPTSLNKLRQTAHQISDIIYEQLTGNRGAFTTRITYVMVDSSEQQRSYRLAVADSDGFNEQIILSSKESLMSPSWSHDGKRLAYVSFEGGHSQIFVQQLADGHREMVADYKGLNSAPSWSPDGKQLALTLSKDGNAEIYILNLATKKLVRVTRSHAIDTEAAWSPDGKSLVFTSDRSGKPQLYRISLERGQPKGRAKRLTFEGGYNARATFSPDGKKIAMIHLDGGGYRIAVMEIASGNLQVLTDTTLDESPSFAANGSMIIYATDVGGRGVLSAVSADGRAHQRLQLNEGDVREPAWSPYLQ
ncbi:MAG: Tol-Pal system beta propeller repeat protein TolB [Gammaproteobacteria bacterium]|nr:Tol-Pal system beta propeller repeat protein TolB [Gammaproteobacteria bacterium]